MLQAERGGYAVYVLMKIVLAIGAAIVIAIVSVILVLVVAIPTVGLGIVAALTGKTAGLSWNVFTITVAVIVGCILLAIFILSVGADLGASDCVLSGVLDLFLCGAVSRTESGAVSAASRESTVRV